MKKSFDKTEVYLRAAFRKVWRWSASRRLCLQKAKGKCELCQKKVRKLYADHIEPVVPITGLGLVHSMRQQIVHLDFNELFERMFYGKLQAICKSCHKKKTKQENLERRKFKNGK